MSETLAFMDVNVLRRRSIAERRQLLIDLRSPKPQRRKAETLESPLPYKYHSPAGRWEGRLCSLTPSQRALERVRYARYSKSHAGRRGFKLRATEAAIERLFKRPAVDAEHQAPLVEVMGEDTHTPVAPAILVVIYAVLWILILALVHVACSGVCIALLSLTIVRHLAQWIVDTAVQGVRIYGVSFVTIVQSLALWTIDKTIHTVLIYVVSLATIVQSVALWTISSTIHTILICVVSLATIIQHLGLWTINSTIHTVLICTVSLATIVQHLALWTIDKTIHTLRTCAISFVTIVQHLALCTIDKTIYTVLICVVSLATIVHHLTVVIVGITICTIRRRTSALKHMVITAITKGRDMVLRGLSQIVHGAYSNSSQLYRSICDVELLCVDLSLTFNGSTMFEFVVTCERVLREDGESKLTLAMECSWF